MKQIFILTLIIIPFVSFAQNCSQLKNGIYKIEYDSSFRNYPKQFYEILNNECFVTVDRQKTKYEIKRTSECSFRLISDEIVDTSKLNDLQKVHLKQKPYFDIYNVEANSYYFVFRVDLHIQSYSGKFIKVEE